MGLNHGPPEICQKVWILIMGTMVLIPIWVLVMAPCSLNADSSETYFSQERIAGCATIKHSKQEDDTFKTIIQELKNTFPCISDRLFKKPMKGPPHEN